MQRKGISRKSSHKLLFSSKLKSTSEISALEISIRYVMLLQYKSHQLQHIRKSHAHLMTLNSHLQLQCKICIQIIYANPTHVLSFQLLSFNLAISCSILPFSPAMMWPYVAVRPSVLDTVKQNNNNNMPCTHIDRCIITVQNVYRKCLPTKELKCRGGHCAGRLKLAVRILS